MNTADDKAAFMGDKWIDSIGDVKASFYIRFESKLGGA